MRVFLVDGTYELFRYYFGAPPHRTPDGAEVGATRAVLGSILGMLEDGATHLGVATDHVIESFRNDMWPGYKSSAGVAPDLLGQFGLLELALGAMGVPVWAMVELEADDALASAAAVARDDPAVDQVVICTPDKDLGQCVIDGRVVQLDRRKRLVLDESAVTAKFGVPPSSIADYLALVGDSSDGYPGLVGWGPKSAALVLSRYGTIEGIPARAAEWEVAVRGALALAATLVAERDRALLFKDLATLRVDRSLLHSVEDLHWHGPTEDFEIVCDRIDGGGLATRAARLAAKRAG
ncbi:MAG TPA: 5'-3' exonuclease H3TH domain-containing protein [Acidimicrobiales bacterium]|jgi:5'-3' exonuclease|nr:5'-3' exonuclease H3TH domain-containing protein [Acidimicrobiales bacterium]